MVESYCQLLTVKEIQWISKRIKTMRNSIFGWSLKWGIVETNQFLRKHMNGRLVLEGKHAVMFSVIIIPHASVHRPRRWRALKPVSYIILNVVKKNCDTTCSPNSNTSVSSYDGLTPIFRFYIGSGAWKVFVYAFFVLFGLMLGFHGH